MADQQPGDTTPVAGMPDPTRNAGSGEGEPPTADLPGRWSGAAAVPEQGGPRRSRWSRVKDRLAGTGGQAADLDDRTTVPAVDPWADQDTPAWPDVYTTPPADPTLFDGPAERTLFETSPAPSPALVNRTPFGASPSASPPSAERTLFETSPAPSSGGAATAPASRAADSAPRPSLLDRVRRETERLRKETLAAAREPVNPAPVPPPPPPYQPVGPAPGTYPPPAGGTGLPPLVRPKWQVWGQQAAASSREAAAAAPERLRSWGQQATEMGRQVADKGRQLADPGRQSADHSRQVADPSRQSGHVADPKRPSGQGADPRRHAADQSRQVADPRRPGAGQGQQVAAGVPGKLRAWRRKAAPEAAAPPRIPVQSRPGARPWTPTPPKPRRRFRRLRRLVLVVTVVIALFTVGPYVQPHIPVLNQYPVTAILPDGFADLTLRDTSAGRQAAQKLAEQLQEAGAGSDTFAGIYGDGKGKRVTVFGVTGLRLTPGSDVEAQLGRLSDSLKLKNVQSYDTGVFGVHQRCGTGRLDGTSVVACSWADHGSLATVLLTRRSLEESADLVSRLRSTVLTTSASLTPLV
ncbi:hypothetical protein [Actinoplanes derwentensis]|uniref:Uncharacterized protein n=1 Tax=Actinoplanes derwentensis TaxID=113562 RepID=A0A1H2CBL0_9ACTN|nr:hypothetical protein [Actinoplanes derwentensis]GID88197.1 hypothetical protein Ade03nite_71210 [Actinoplanes derwentensis]SDT67863.1 hypothetical protein SAMN04489716_5534 [Actinoplanes derwentensis]